MEPFFLAALFVQEVPLAGRKSETALREMTKKAGKKKAGGKSELRAEKTKYTKSGTVFSKLQDMRESAAAGVGAGIAKEPQSSSRPSFYKL
jgi:hypothetical protein